MSRPDELGVTPRTVDNVDNADNADEVASLRAQLLRTEQHMAQTLMRATRLAQVISVLGSQRDLETIVERVAIDVGELFFADVTLLILESEDGLRVPGYWGISASDLPEEPFTLPDVDEFTERRSVRIGPVQDMPVPEWLTPYSPRHIAWARLLVGSQSLGLLLLARRGDEAFDESEANELRAVAYRIALAVENGLLHQRMQDQVAQLHRLQELTAALAGTLELAAVGQRVADMVVSETSASSSAVLIARDGELSVLSSGGAPRASGTDHVEILLDPAWRRFPLKVGDRTLGAVAVTGAPEPGSEAEVLLLHLVSLGALSLDKALLHEQSREQARLDSLTGLLGHRVFHEELAALIAAAKPFSVLLFDIDDFKQVNDLYGHQTGDRALRLVAEALRQGTRSGDTVFRVGGEEFCALLPGLAEQDAFAVAEGIRQRVATIVAAPPSRLTVSAGVASFPTFGVRRDELLGGADTALYASKRAGKNCTNIAGGKTPEGLRPPQREIGLDVLQRHDSETVSHSIDVSILSVDIARELELPENRLDDLRISARLHDIGKLGVPDAILQQTGPLGEEEFRIVKTHPVLGAALLRSWGFTEPATIVLQHHEQMDGSGYPDGLRGEETLIESRIIHAADAYLAMICDRPYRQAMSQAEAVAELVLYSGTQFDPDVVTALIAVVGPVLERSAAVPERMG